MTRAELLELLKKARKQLEKYHVPKDEQTIKLSIDTLENALSEQQQLLKEQETEAEIEGGGTTWWYVCGECHTAIDKRDHFCRQCGRKIKWE